MSLGCAREAEVDLEGAALCFRRAIEIDQENSYAHFLLGCILHDIGDLHGAERCFRRLIEIVSASACRPLHLYIAFSYS